MTLVVGIGTLSETLYSIKEKPAFLNALLCVFSQPWHRWHWGRTDRGLVLLAGTLIPAADTLHILRATIGPPSRFGQRHPTWQSDQLSFREREAWLT